MQEAVPAGVGAMAALLKLPEDALDGVLAEAAQGEVVTAANLNSPDQIVIAGHAAAVERAMELAKAAGAQRAVLLPVSAPFHCPLMKPAQERLQADLDATDFRDLAVPLINNWQAREIRTGAEAREGCTTKFPIRFAGPIPSGSWLSPASRDSSKSAREACSPGCCGISTRRSSGAKFGEASDWEKLAA